jgi:hypothetical protein
VSTTHDRVIAALEATVVRRLDEVEDWQHQQRIARAVLDALELRTEYAWACDQLDCQRTPHRPDLQDEDAIRRWARDRAALAGAVYVREVTDWRAES